MGAVSMFKYLAAHLMMTLVCMYLAGAAAVEYNVVSLGAKQGGKVDAAKPFLSAWASACGSAKAATVRVPNGTFLLSPVVFKGPCKNKGIKFFIDGTLVAPTSGGSKDWIRFERVEGVSVYGGTLDGRGARLWACKTGGGSNCPRGDNSLTINRSKKVKISKLTSIDSKLFHIWINGCDGVDVDAVKLIAPDNSPNTDGIHVQVSTGITITKSTITTGDDCISVGPGTFALRVERVFCGPGHGIR
ncbi:hypothetical protein Taro_036154 [Colocasia esculenta]|uniref:Polygalacturonase n=1 Tax=Colocasia esculenta TaxID=4460 RepID=A0A843WFH6_COLES|nr:hypothetical protein [Colocasia esculenta]